MCGEQTREGGAKVEALKLDQSRGEEERRRQRRDGERGTT